MTQILRKRNKSVLQSVFVLMLFLCFFLVIRNEYEEVERFLKEHRLLFKFFFPFSFFVFFSVFLIQEMVNFLKHIDSFFFLLLFYFLFLNFLNYNNNGLIIILWKRTMIVKLINFPFLFYVNLINLIFITKKETTVPFLLPLKYYSRKHL